MSKKPVSPASGFGTSPSNPKASAPVDVRCAVSSCKSSHSRFGFCATHYDEFKFGLVTKTGEPAADYDKKIDHYKRFKERQKAGKAA